MSADSIIIEAIALFISFVSIFLSFFVLRERRLDRIDRKQARITVDIMRMEGDLFLFIRNVGAITAHNVFISVKKVMNDGNGSGEGEKIPALLSEDIVIVSPDTVYKCPLIKTNDVPQFKEVEIYVEYRDKYNANRKEPHKYSIKTNLSDCAKCNMKYDKEMKWFEVSKI